MAIITDIILIHSAMDMVAVTLVMVHTAAMVMATLATAMARMVILVIMARMAMATLVSAMGTVDAANHYSQCYTNQTNNLPHAGGYLFLSKKELYSYNN